jgi:3-dehydroquinate synthase/shikimate kinase/3-dehydroquinate synthase
MDKKLFNFLNKNGNHILKLKNPYIEKAIYRSCLIKKQVIEKDENEKNLRKILNFGHTFAHAYEATNNYSNKLNHGEAVLLGMVSASNFALQNIKLNKNDYQNIINHYKKFNLPMSIKNFFFKKNINKILSFMQKDKKNKNSKINLILLKNIGNVDYNYYFKSSKIYKFLNKELIN